MTEIRSLWDLKEKYDYSHDKEKVQIDTNYMVEVKVMDYEGKVKLFHKDYQVYIHKEYYN